MAFPSLHPRYVTRSCSALVIAGLVVASLVVPSDRTALDNAKVPAPRPAASPTKLLPLRTNDVPATEEDLSVFEGLGAWVDLFDLGLDPVATTRRLAASGVRTLYLQTARSNSATMISTGVGRWLVAGHRAGLRVVGWYLPFYAQVPFDIERTLAVARFWAAGHRFDAVGIDIEARAAVRGATAWNARVVAHIQEVRTRLGPGMPLAAIVPTPLQMRVAPTHWAGFPWRELGGDADALLLMSYWSDRRGCPAEPKHCAYGYTTVNIELARALANREGLIVHVVGGVGDSIDAVDVAEFVRGAKDAAADGASLYDVRTTRPAWWDSLEELQELGR